MKKSLDIIFVNPHPNASGINEATIEPPLGLAYMAAVLEENDFSPLIIDANALGLGTDEVVKTILKKKPRIVGISANIVTAPSAFELAKELKKKSDAVVIFGGPHPSAVPEEVMDKCPADALVIGEGEMTILEICKRMKTGKPLFNKVKGVMYRGKRGVIKNSPRELIENLDSLPLPAHHLLPDFSVYKTRARRKPVASIFTSRGCPFKCVYCNSSIFGKRYRMRSAKNVLEEIDYLVSNFGIRQIDILDDNFTLVRSRVEEILNGIIMKKYNIAINLQNGVRADKVDYPLIKLMKKAGVFKVAFGVETGDKGVLSRIKKSLDLKAVVNATKWAKKEGITTYGFFMFGLPGDTKRSMKKTIDFALKMDPDIAHFGITIPFPGTELYSEVKKRGVFLIKIDDGLPCGFEAGEVFYLLDGLKKNDVEYYYKKAYKDFYFRPSKMFKTIIGIRSFDELRWIIDAGFLLAKGLIKSGK